MLKHLLITFALLAIWLLAMSKVQAQKINPYMGVDYHFSGGYLFSQYLQKVDQTTDENFIVTFGSEFTIIKNLWIDANAITLTEHDKNLSFRPLMTYYHVSLNLRIKNVIVKYEHQCVHPSGTLNYDTDVRIYGGYDKIGVYWKLNNTNN